MNSLTVLDSVRGNMYDNETESDEILESILFMYAKYINDAKYVYKKCRNDLIVVLKKMDDTITNETRTSVVDSRYAKFRGNCFYVELIISSTAPQYTFTSANSIHVGNFEYVTGTLVKAARYDPNDDDICAGGIHYFKDIRGAYYYAHLVARFPINFSGVKRTYYDNGQLATRRTFVNGIINGIEVSWYENGKLRYQCNYADKKPEGWVTTWYKNGRIESQYKYEDGMQNGSVTKWYENGQVKCQYSCGDDMKQGEYVEWDANGVVSYKCNYHNDTKIM